MSKGNNSGPCTDDMGDGMGWDEMERGKEGGKMQDARWGRAPMLLYFRKEGTSSSLPPVYTECNQYSGLHVLLNCFRLPVLTLASRSPARVTLPPHSLPPLSSLVPNPEACRGRLVLGLK